MAASRLALNGGINVARPPGFALLSGFALAGCAAAVATFAITYGIDEPAPVVNAALVGWITLAYVVCGLIAWWRRPQSRFGPLMVAAGFGPLASRLSELDASLPHTAGDLHDLEALCDRISRRLDEAADVSLADS